MADRKFDFSANRDAYGTSISPIASHGPMRAVVKADRFAGEA